jgi:hypothetical protein
VEAACENGFSVSSASHENNTANWNVLLNAEYAIDERVIIAMTTVSRC